MSWSRESSAEQKRAKQDLGDRIMRRGCAPCSLKRPFASIGAGVSYENMTRGNAALSIPQPAPVLGLFSPLLELPNPLSEIRGGLPIGGRRPAGGRPLRAKRDRGPVHVYRPSSAEVVVGPSYS